MRGAIVGDIAGSRFEFESYKSKDFDLLGDDDLDIAECRFTDDTVMTASVAAALMRHNPSDGRAFRRHLCECMHEIGKEHLLIGFGDWQYEWLKKESFEPYNSYGNGSAMRVSPVGWYAKSLDEAEYIAKLTAEVTHNHPEGIKGAQAIATSVYLARTGKDKDQIASYIASHYYPSVGNMSLDAIRKTYDFDVTCKGSVPHSIQCFLDSKGFEDAVRLAVSLGGDSDTMGAMAGSIAEAYYGLPDGIWEKARKLLSEDIQEITDEFYTMCMSS